MATNVVSTARRAGNSTAMTVAARAGLATRGLVYLIIGWLAVDIARGHGNQQANQTGALATVAHRSFGTVLLWLMAFGFAGYAVWRLSEAAFGTAAQGRKTGPRLKSLVRGVVYAGFATSTFAFVLGRSRRGQAQQQETVTASVLRHHDGRWLVGVAGVVVLIVGLAMVVDGLRRKFMRELQTSAMSHRTRVVVCRFGMIGTVARGIVVAIAGALVVQAARTYDAAKSTGLDGALRDLASHTYGSWLLGAVALGLIAFGLYGLAAARYAKV